MTGHSGGWGWGSGVGGDGKLNNYRRRKGWEVWKANRRRWRWRWLCWVTDPWKQAGLWDPEGDLWIGIGNWSEEELELRPGLGLGHRLRQTANKPKHRRRGWEIQNGRPATATARPLSSWKIKLRVESFPCTLIRTFVPFPPTEKPDKCRPFKDCGKLRKNLRRQHRWKLWPQGT